MTVSEHLALVSKCFCAPLAIIVNFSLFQYLLTVYSARRRDLLVRLLLLAAFLSFATLIPFAYPDEHLVHSLRDMSDACSVLTFTQQIALLARDVSKKMKLPMLGKLQRLADMFVLLGWMLVVSNTAHIAAPTAEGIEITDHFDVIFEYLALIFVVVFRFYFLATARGWRTVWDKQKREVVYYLLFLTHAVPFHVAESATGLELDGMQALWMRLTMALCLSSTIRAKLLAMSSLGKSRTTGKPSSGKPSSEHHTTLNRQAQRPSSVKPPGGCMDSSMSDNSHVDFATSPKLETTRSRGDQRSSKTVKQSSVQPAGAPATKTLVESLHASRRTASQESVGVRGIARTASIHLAKRITTVAPTP